MAGLHVTEWQAWSEERRREFAAAMTRDELRDCGLSDKEYFCAALGYVREPRKRRANVPLAARRHLAKRYGCPPGETVAVECVCGTTGHVTWHRLSSGLPSSWVSFSDLDIDHITPLSLGGGNEPENLQLRCPRCNRSKGNRWVG